MRIICLSFLISLYIFCLDAEAGRGCCSWHGGVSHCDSSVQKYVCKDGTHSPTCACMGLNFKRNIPPSTTLFSILPSPSPQYSKSGYPETQKEMTEDACEDYKKSDQKLNKIYQQIMSSIEEEQKHKLVEAQRAWIKFRDAHLEALWSGCNSEDSSSCGSVHPMCHCLKKKHLTEKRIEELEEFLNKKEGDVCMPS